MWIGGVPIQRACNSRASGAWGCWDTGSQPARSVQKPLQDAGIAVNAAVAQERPVAADGFQQVQGGPGQQGFFFVRRGLPGGSPTRGGPERSRPELHALGPGAI